MNLFEYNNVLYKGNVKRDFYLFCLKKNRKIIKYLFLNIWYYILSFLFKSKNDIYEKKQFMYLKEVENLELVIEEFYKKERYNHAIDNKVDLIIDRVPCILIKHSYNTNIIGYELNNEYEVELEKYNNEISNIKEVDRLFVRTVFV